MASTLYVMADRQGPATGEDRYALGRKDSEGSAGYQPVVETEGVSRGATSWTIAREKLVVPVVMATSSGGPVSQPASGRRRSTALFSGAGRPTVLR
jgi:hypothetical protein